MKAAEFDGKLLTLNAEGFLMMALINPGESDAQMQFSGTLAIPLRDAFLVEIPTGWRLVGGVNESGCRLNRSTLTDTAPGAGERAAQVEQLGVPVLRVEAGTANLKQHGIAMYDVTR